MSPPQSSPIEVREWSPWRAAVWPVFFGLFTIANAVFAWGAFVHSNPMWLVSAAGAISSAGLTVWAWRRARPPTWVREVTTSG